MQLGISIIFKSYSVGFGTKQWQQHFQHRVSLARGINPSSTVSTQQDTSSGVDLQKKPQFSKKKYGVILLIVLIIKLQSRDSKIICLLIFQISGG